MLTPIKALWSRGGAEETLAAERPLDGQASFELQVARLGLGYDEDSKLFILVAHDAESGADDPPNFRCRCSRSQLSRLSRSIAIADVRRRRPRCPICGNPLDGSPHFCPGSNGHTH